MNLMSFFLDVIKKDNQVYITGINSKYLQKDFKSVLKDNRFFLSVFTTTKRSVQFNEFFLPEVYFVFNEIKLATKSRIYKGTIDKVLAKLEENTWITEIEKDVKRGLDFNRIKDFYYKPLEYQKEFFDYYDESVRKYKLKGTLLAAAAGSGKTYISLCLSSLLNADRVVVVCPKNAVNKVWEKEVKGLYKNPPSVNLSTDKKRFTDEKVVVYHYEALAEAIEDIESLNSNCSNIVFILDESHNFNEIKSIRSTLLLELVSKLNTNDIIFMSGTPVKALGSELAVMFRAIDPSFDDEVQSIFGRLYGKASSSQNLELLQVKLGKVQFKVEKSRLNIGKPEVIPLVISLNNGKEFTLKEVSIKMSEFVKKRTDYYANLDTEYKKLVKDILSDVVRKNINDGSKVESVETYRFNIETIRKAHDSGNLGSVLDLINVTKTLEKNVILPLIDKDDRKLFKDVISAVKYPKLKIRGEALGNIMTKERIRCFEAMAEKIDLAEIIDSSEKKVVVFSSFIKVCEKVVANTKSLGYKPATVYGEYSKFLNREVNDFNTKDEVNPMVATFNSLSTAVPLIVANTVVFIDLPYRDNIRTQAVARVHRLGATTNTYVVECSLDTGEEPNLSSRTMDIITWSRDQVNLIMGDMVDELETIATESYVEDVESKPSSNFLSNW